MSVTSIEGLYVGYFGRAADPAGLNYWLGQEAAGLTDTQIASSFAVQVETMNLYPSLATPTLLDQSPTAEANFINAIYTNLFGHTADTAGLSYWQGQLTAGVSPGIMISQVISGAAGTDATAFSSKEGVATTYTTSVLNASPSVAWSKADATASKSILTTVTSAATASATGPSITAAIVSDQGGNSGVTGVTLTLPSTGGTAGVAATTNGAAGTQATVNISPTATGTGAQQTVNGANNTIRGLGVSDLNSAATINGGTGGANILNAPVSVFGYFGGTTVNPIISNVQTVNLDPVTVYTQTVAKGDTANTTVTFSAAGDSGIALLNEAGGSILGTNNTVLVLANVALTTSVGMSNATAANNDTLYAGFSSIPTSGGAISLVLNNNGGGTFDTTLNASGNLGGTGAGIQTYNISTVGAKLSTLTITNNDTALTGINITTASATGALTLTENDLSVTSINGATATANLILNVGALTGKATITGGNGIDLINATGDAKAVNLVDGTGIGDTLNFNGNVATSNVTIGNGTATLNIGGANANGVNAADTGLTYFNAGSVTTDNTANAQLTTDLEQVTGFTATTKIAITGVAAANVNNTLITANAISTAVNNAGNNNLIGAINNLASAIHASGAAGEQVVAFTYTDGNSYLYQDNNVAATTSSSGDGVLRLNGVTSSVLASALSSNNIT